MGSSHKYQARRRSSVDRAWCAALQSAMQEMVDHPRSGGKAGPRVRVLSVSATGARFEVELRFVAGELYCCSEAGCFLATGCRGWWQRLRENLAEHSDRVPPALSLFVHVAVEKGAKLEVLRSIGLPVESGADAWRQGPDRERDAR